MVPPEGAGGALAADDTVADGDGLATRGGGAAVHCASMTPAAITLTSTATHRMYAVNWDESSRLLPSRQDRCDRVSLDKSAAKASGVN
jgi:hypothetical protein